MAALEPLAQRLVAAQELRLRLTSDLELPEAVPVVALHLHVADLRRLLDVLGEVAPAPS